MTDRVRVLHPTGGESRTKQADSLSSDINSIMSKYVKTGYLPVTPGRKPRYGDFSNLPDFHTAQNAVKEAEREFLRLPLAVREACENDPGAFVDMIHDPEGRKVLEGLGLPEEAVPEGAPAAAEEVPPENSEPVVDPPQEPV